MGCLMDTPIELAKRFCKLETLNVSSTQLTVTQIEAILDVIKNGFTLRHLDISYNNLSLIVDPWILARAVTKLETLNVSSTDLTDTQIALLLSAVREGMAGLDISHNCNIATVDQVVGPSNEQAGVLERHGELPDGPAETGDRNIG